MRLGLGHLALPDQRERDVGERREVAAAADRAVSRHDRRDPRVEQADHRFGHRGPDAGKSHRKRSRPQQHRRAHDLVLDRRSHARGVGADERQLKLRLAKRGDARARQGSETSRHAVNRLPRRGRALDARPAALHPGPRLRRQRDLLAVTGHRDHLLLAKAGAAQRDRHR